MNQNTLDILTKLLTDCQTGFFFYTLVYFGFRISKGKETLREFDKNATIIICAVSALFLMLWIGQVVYAWNISEENRLDMQNRMFGPYAFAYWLPPFFYFALPQLLWMRKIRENYLSRFLIAFFLFFNFEKFAIIATSLHRDYLPSSQPMFSETDGFWILFWIAWKFTLFTGLAALLFSVRRKKDNFAL